MSTIIHQSPRDILALVQDRLQQLGSRSDRTGLHWQCPIHDDHTPSLSLSPGANGLRIKCWAGCSHRDILSVLGLHNWELNWEYTRRDETIRPWEPSVRIDRPLAGQRNRQRQVAAGLRGGALTKFLTDCFGEAIMDRPVEYPIKDGWAKWVYCHADGSVAYEKFRYVDPLIRRRRFVIRSRSDGAKWVWRRLGEPLLYRGEHLAHIERSDPLIIVEGEKDVNSLESLAKRTEWANSRGYVPRSIGFHPPILGHFLTSGGCSSWQDSFGQFFADRAEVWLWPDADPAGESLIPRVRHSIPHVRVLQGYPGGAKDTSEWMEQGWELGQMMAYARSHAD